MKQVQNWFLGGLLALVLTGSALADFQKGQRAFLAGDYATALAEWKPLALAGDAGLQNEVGWMYAQMKDYAEAVKWYRRAAESGLPLGQYNLGQMYHNGTGVLQNHAEALRWYRPAVEAGNVLAQTNLGVMYLNGEGVRKNYRVAYMWSSIAAARGNELARENRDLAAKRMTRKQIDEAQEMSRQCTRQNYKKCRKLAPN